MFSTCLSIFSARVIDVSLGTLRTVYTVKGKQLIAGMVAFFEVFIWFLVAREALNTDINSIWIPISYSLGYATGTMLGTYISSTFINGLVLLQATTKKGNKKLIDKIRSLGYGVSIVPLNNAADSIKKEMLFIETTKKTSKSLVEEIKKIDPSAFIIVNETKYVQNGFVK